MNLIVAVDEKWGIGKDNDLLISIPEDMKFFRTITKNSIIIMGRKTLESFPNGKPLKNRENIVLTKSNIKEDVTIFNSIEDVLNYVKNKENVFVIGGGSIYKQLLPYCEKAYVTKIKKDFNADVFFPNLDEKDDWELINFDDNKEWNGISYQFTTYKHKL